MQTQNEKSLRRNVRREVLLSTIFTMNSTDELQSNSFADELAQSIDAGSDQVVEAQHIVLHQNYLPLEPLPRTDIVDGILYNSAQQHLEN